MTLTLMSISCHLLHNPEPNCDVDGELREEQAGLRTKRSYYEQIVICGFVKETCKEYYEIDCDG